MSTYLPNVSFTFFSCLAAFHDLATAYLWYTIQSFFSALVCFIGHPSRFWMHKWSLAQIPCTAMNGFDIQMLTCASRWPPMACIGSMGRNWQQRVLQQAPRAPICVCIEMANKYQFLPPRKALSAIRILWNFGDNGPAMKWISFYLPMRLLKM